MILFLGIYLTTHSGNTANIAFLLWLPVGFEPWLSQRKRKKRRITFDERDLNIQLQANEVGYMLGFWLFVGIVFIFTFLNDDDMFQIHMWQLRAVTYFLVFVPFAIRSLVVLCLYRFGTELNDTTD